MLDPPRCRKTPKLVPTRPVIALLPGPYTYPGLTITCGTRTSAVLVDDFVLPDLGEAVGFAAALRGLFTGHVSSRGCLHGFCMLP